MEEAAAVLLIVLIVLYLAMLLVLGFRAKALKYFGRSNKEVRTFYVSIIVFLVLRVVGLIVVVTLSDFIGKKIVFVMLEVPRAASIVPFVLLAIIKLNKTFEGHMTLHINKTFIDGMDKKPILHKFKPAVIVAVLVFLTGFLALLACFLAGVVNGNVLDIFLGSFDILISTALLIFAIILHKKFSGVPAKSDKWAKMLKKLNFVSVFWITGRTAKSVLDFLAFISVTAQVTMVFGASNLTEIILIILAIFVTEILNIMLTIDYAFFRMFIERDQYDAAQVTSSSTESKQMTFKKHRLSMVSANPYIDDKEIEISEEIIGRVNSLGKMFKASYLGRQLAYRKIMISNVSTYITEEVQQEVEIYKQLCISGLVRVTAIVLNANTVGLAYPFYENSLYKLLHVEGKKWTFNEKILVLAKIAEILADIHAEGKVHGHLTSHNILFDENEPLVSDLGFHKLKKYIGIKNSYNYKSAWSSPEILKDPRSTPQNVTPMSDVYSFGIICWEVFTENEPFPQFTIEQIKKKVVEEKVRPMIPSDLNLELSRFIQSCFNEDSNIRPESGSLVSLLNY